MPTEQYGQSQIKEITFTRQELKNLLIENVLARTSTPYDFDYRNPIIFWAENGNVILRYVQLEITQKEDLKSLHLKTLENKIR